MMGAGGLSWDAVAILATVVVACFGALFQAIRWLFLRYHEQLKLSFADFAQKLGDQGTELHRIDKDILKLRAELPRDYVRREDAIREQVVINAKLDTLAAKIDQLNARAGQ